MHSDSQPFVRVAVWGEAFHGDKFHACAAESQPERLAYQKGHKMDTERAQNSESCSAYKDLCGG